MPKTPRKKSSKTKQPQSFIYPDHSEDLLHINDNDVHIYPDDRSLFINGDQDTTVHIYNPNEPFIFTTENYHAFSHALQDIGHEGLNIFGSNDALENLIYKTNTDVFISPDQESLNDRAVSIEDFESVKSSLNALLKDASSSKTELIEKIANLGNKISDVEKYFEKVKESAVETLVYCATCHRLISRLQSFTFGTVECLVCKATRTIPSAGVRLKPSNPKR